MSFNLIIVDEDRKLYNLITNLKNDDYHSELITKAQEAGRNVRCFNPNTNNMQQILVEMADMGYKRTEDNVLIRG